MKILPWVVVVALVATSHVSLLMKMTADATASRTAIARLRAQSVELADAMQFAEGLKRISLESAQEQIALKRRIEMLERKR